MEYIKANEVYAEEVEAWEIGYNLGKKYWGNVMKKLGFKYEKDIDYDCNDGSVHLEGEQYRLYL